MSLEEINEIFNSRLAQLLSFIQKVEVNSYCDPEQFVDAQETLKTLINELYLLGYKMEYLKYGYSNICLDEVA